MSNPLVSVIVPVYKVEDVLLRCLETLCKQSLKEIEVILIDDGSPDRSGEICEEFATKDSRFKVIHHTENKGLSAARNTGIRQASANYLMFVDSDDWVHEDFCKVAYDCAVKNHADMCWFRRQERINKKTGALSRLLKIMMGKIERKETSCPSPVFKTQLEALEQCENVVWNKIYRKGLFTDVMFDEGFYFEDVGFTYRICLKSNSIYFINKLLYYNTYREGSITTLRNEKALEDMLTMHIRRHNDLAVWGYPADKLDLDMKNIAMMYVIRKKADASDSNYMKFLKLLRQTKRSPENFTEERKLLFLLLKYSPPLFELVCTVLGKKFC